MPSKKPFSASATSDARRLRRQLLVELDREVPQFVSTTSCRSCPDRALVGAAPRRRPSAPAPRLGSSQSSRRSRLAGRRRRRPRARARGGGEQARSRMRPRIVAIYESRDGPVDERAGDLDLVRGARQRRRRVERLEQPRDRRRTRRARSASARRPARRRRRRARTPSASGPSPSGRRSTPPRARSSSRISSPGSSVVVERSSAVGSRYSSAIGSSRRSVRIVAPSASSAAAGSDGCAEAQSSLPKNACSRCWPALAWQRSPPCR